MVDIYFIFGAFFIIFGLSFIYYAKERFLGEMKGKFIHNHFFTTFQWIFNLKGLIGSISFIIGLIIFDISNQQLNYFLNIIIFILLGIIGIALAIGINMIFKKYSIGYPFKNVEKPEDKPLLKFYLKTNQKNEIQDEFSLFEKSFDEVNNTLLRNLIAPFGKTKSWFSIPGSKYPAAYLWDSSFISGAWRMWDSKIAQNILCPFLDHQRKDGFCPQTIPFGIFKSYSISNPPLLAFAMVLSAEMTGDYSNCKNYYASFQEYETYLENNRQDQGLFKWKHSYESGIDNSPRFTDISESEHYDLTSLWAIDFNVWMYLHYQSMKKIATKMNKQEDIKKYDLKSKILSDLIQEKLWDSEKGYYFDYDYAKKEFVRVPTIFSLFPLYLGICNDDQKLKLLNHIKDPNVFNTNIPFPTVAHDDPSFIKDTWRGPVWINTAWVALQGVFKTNNEILAGEMAYHLVRGVYQTFANCGSFYEFYDPDQPNLEDLQRKKGNFWKQITLGGKPVYHFCGWTALVNTILIENILGYSRIENILNFYPHFPIEWKNCEISLTIPQFHEEIRFEYSEDNSVSVQVRDLKSIKPLRRWKGKNNNILEKLE